MRSVDLVLLARNALTLRASKERDERAPGTRLARARVHDLLLGERRSEALAVDEHYDAE